ncbi:hypothetical protein [Sphingobium cupriresistens]|uniref:Uncharacterized protein n=1 Tax=Sphingobium cupriresistens LL01 TaxID=1420583 RepID=A0A0J7Y5W7_9SPHN|nr:hypothetical protein [Sphingobium cupriresistens]KMS58788.1 hypothetical protein V473_07245 [Sphingobium cupriresistens LL01]
MTDTIAELRELLAACTKGDLTTAERRIACETVECPACQGDGEVEAADYCNFDSVALGVQFYGIGQEFGVHEKLWTAVVAALPALLDRVEAGEVWRKHYFDMAKAAGDLKAAIRPQLDAMTFADHAEVRKAFNDIAIVAGRALDHMQGSMKPPQKKADIP